LLRTEGEADEGLHPRSPRRISCRSRRPSFWSFRLQGRERPRAGFRL